MAQFVATNPNVQVLGIGFLAWIEAAGIFKDNLLKILDRCGISDLKPEVWYPHQQCLDAARIIGEEVGPGMLFQIGKYIPSRASFPNEIVTLDSALLSINTAYHLNHRGDTISNYLYEKTGQNTGNIICRTPYPCDFELGLFTSLCERFKPSGSLAVTVAHDPTQPCRKNGQDTCTYLIKW